MPDIDFEYLRDPRFLGFSADVFSNSARLPILGGMVELAPVFEEDEFYLRQVCSMAEVDPGNATSEFKRAERGNMIMRVASTGRIVNYVRIPTPRWDVVEAAVKAAKEEIFGILPPE